MNKRFGAALGAFLLAAGFCASATQAAAASNTAFEKTNEAFMSDESVSASLSADTEVSSRFLELLFGKKKKKDPHIDNIKEDEATVRYLCPGGDVFGIKIAKDAVSVVCAEEDCILKYGDIIISIDGKRIHSLSDVKKILEASDGTPMLLVIERGKEKFEAEITPKNEKSQYKLGAVLKDGVAGIGTVTYFDPATGEFGGLGHAICESGSKEPVKMKDGSVCDVILGGVDKSKEGDPGELTGILTDKTTGKLYSNTDEGVFGKFNTPPDKERPALPVGSKNDVHEGEAVIYSTVKNGMREEYKVEIFEIDRNSDGPKSFKVRIKDDTLKTLTGGIVRGMSGSPIIQDGKIIGALTHVMIAKPDEGYGIFIENMLEAGGTIPGKKAA